jgi:hypothetical protein
MVVQFGFVGILITLTGCAAVQKEPLQAASLVVQGIQFVFSRSVPDRLPVSAIGTGSTREEATNNALLSAMQEGVGVLVAAETVVSGNRVTREFVAQYSSAIVQSYKVVECKGTSRIQCSIDAVVTPWRFYEVLRDASTTTKVDGKSLYAQHLTQQHSLEQRKRLTEYFLSKIRTDGLEAVVQEIRVEPSASNEVLVYLKYRVRYKKDFWRELVSFLERLERDTGGGTDWNGRRQDPRSSQNPRTVYIQWGATGLRENRVYIHTFDQSFYSMMQKYRVEIPVSVSIPELNFCDRVELGNSYGMGFFGDVFQVDWYNFTREHKLRVQPNALKNIEKITMQMGC